MHQEHSANQQSFEPILLAFFDVLGFSDRVSRVGLHEIYQQYQEIIAVVEGNTAERIIEVVIPDGTGGLDGGLCLRTLQHAYFSDTVMIWVKYDLPVVQSFLESALDFFCEALLRGLAMRGCITFGPAIMSTRDGIFLGDPIIEGARGEQAQSWLGVSFGPSVNQKSYGWLGALHHVMPYHEHAKPGKESLVEPLVLDWPRRWRDKYSGRPSAVEVLKGLNTDARFTSYYDGALKFVAHSAECSAWWKSFDFRSKSYDGYVLSEGDSSAANSG
jgi:hypothetical protein